MYIFELIYKIVSDFKSSKNKEIETNAKEEESTICEHIFLPVDSTKKILACTKCGMLIKTTNLTNKNQL